MGETGQKKTGSQARGHLLAKSQPLPDPAGDLGTEMLSQGLSRQVNWALMLLAGHWLMSVWRAVNF